MDFFDKFMELFLPVSNGNAITVNIQSEGLPVGTLEFYPNKGARLTADTHPTTTRLKGG
jgi:hypothetical protein